MKPNRVKPLSYAAYPLYARILMTIGFVEGFAFLFWFCTMPALPNVIMTGVLSWLFYKAME